jgi:hypothetical protein
LQVLPRIPANVQERMTVRENRNVVGAARVGSGFAEIVDMSRAASAPGRVMAFAAGALAVLLLSRVPSATGVEQLWVQPEPGRDLFHGVGGPRLAPDPLALYQVIGVKKGGFSSGYTVRDRHGRVWSAKLYPEARTEVVASRILWAVGYHQPPAYTLEQWSAAGAKGPNPQAVARFREKKPDFHGLKEAGTWSYSDNPFVGTRPLAGLLVLNVMLGNADMKAGNNRLYTLNRPVEGATRWYVARDLGSTFGRTRILDSPRDDIEAFDSTPFINGVRHGTVEFEYRGIYPAPLRNVSVADVRWICTLLSRLTDQQWADAFRAGGYLQPTAQRYIRRLKIRIAEGLALPDER